MIQAAIYKRLSNGEVCWFPAENDQILTDGERGERASSRVQRTF